MLLIGTCMKKGSIATISFSRNPWTLTMAAVIQFGKYIWLIFIDVILQWMNLALFFTDSLEKVCVRVSHQTEVCDNIFQSSLIYSKENSLDC